MRRLYPLLLLLCLAGCTYGVSGVSVSTTPTATSAHPGAQPRTTPAAATPTAKPQRPTATATTKPPTPTTAITPNDFISRAIARTNTYRSQFQCPPLKDNAKLDQSALSHSQDMAIHAYFDHNSPSGQTPWDRIHAAGYQFSSAAENIAAGYQTPEAVIDAFFNETPPNDGHRRNLLNCSLRDVGIGYYYQQGSPYGFYWTQDFATPL